MIGVNCKDCDKSFGTARSLQAHKVVHANQEQEDGEIKVIDFDKNKAEYKGDVYGSEGAECFRFRGKKKGFAQGTVEIKKLFHTNKEYGIDDVKFSLDKKHKNDDGGSDFALNVANKDENGKAMLKVWGPNNKKEWVIVVTKLKQYDQQFAKLLADVVKTLLDLHISGEGWKPKLESKNTIECKKCGKLYSTQGFLRAHMEKMHRSDSQIGSTKGVKRSRDAEDIDQLKCKFCTYKGRSKYELQNHVHIKHNSEVGNRTDIGEDNLKVHKVTDQCDNESTDSNDSPNITHVNQCDLCDVTFKGESKVDSILKVNAHKSNCLLKIHTKPVVPSNCNNCEYTSCDNEELKKHNRDEHLVRTESTSPVKKHRKVPPSSKTESVTEKIVNINKKDVIEEDQMDVTEMAQDEKMDVSVESKGTECTNKQDEEKELSNKNDLKILEKRKRIEKEESDNKIRKKKKAEEDQKKEAAEKGEKKRRKKKMKKVSKPEKNEGEFEKVPEKYKKLFDIKGLDSDEYRIRRVGGGGLCGAYCMALHLTSVHDDGQAMRKEINQHKVENWDMYKETYPDETTARVGAKTKEFKTKEEILQFLQEEPEEASRMWVDHTDLQAVSNMYKVPINVFTTGIPNHNPECHRCKPSVRLTSEEKLKEHNKTAHDICESEEVLEGRKAKARWTKFNPDNRCDNTKEQLIDMYLMHQDDVHYDLLVHKDHALRQTDSQEKPPNKQDELTKEETETVHEKLKVSEEKRKVLEEKLKVSQGEVKHEKASRIKLEELYTACVGELKRIGEDHGRIKIELSDRNEFIKAKDDMTQHNEVEVEGKKPVKEKVCNFVWKVKSHKKSASVGNTSVPKQHIKQFNCKDCEFQGNSTAILNRHTKSKHNGKEEVLFKCMECNYQFGNNWNLMNHRCDEYGAKQDRMQFNCMECEFQGTSITILNRHKNGKHKGEEDVFRCNECDKQFGTNWNMMNHRSEEHGVKEVCRYFREGRCNFGKTCWYDHKEKTAEEKDQIICYVCNQVFKTKNRMMRHRKENHRESVRNCNSESCHYDSQTCWFNHKDNDGSDNQNQGFQKVTKKLVPPGKM